MIMDCKAGTSPLYPWDDDLMGGNWLGWGCMVLTLVKEVCDS